MNTFTTKNMSKIFHRCVLGVILFSANPLFAAQPAVEKEQQALQDRIESGIKHEQLKLQQSTDFLLLKASARGDLQEVKHLLKPFNVLAAEYITAPTEICSMILEYAPAANPNARNEFGQTALLLASLNGHADVVSELLTYGANPLIGDFKGNLPIFLAHSHGHRKVVHLLIPVIVCQLFFVK